MNIVTVLFCYNRPAHTAIVLKALSENYELPVMLYVFQDGLKNEKHREGWIKVNELINTIEFCRTEIMVSEQNKGLAQSIMYGITYVSDRCDAFIVLEDDCVPDKNFMGFMNHALAEYSDSKQVYTVTGYSYGEYINKNGYDAYFVGRISSWGWGSWSDRWSKFVPNEQDLYEMMFDCQKSIHLATWGNDMESSLEFQKKEMTDSWAVFWALHVLNREGYCLAPCHALIRNIGFDGTGVHSGITDEFDVELEGRQKREFCLPKNIEFNLSASGYFKRHYGGWLVTRGGENQKKVTIYGFGAWFKKNEKIISEQFNVIKFIDKKKTGFYAGRRLFSIDDYVYAGEVIIVSLIDNTDGMRVKQELISKKEIPKERILVLGSDAIFDSVMDGNDENINQ